MRPMYISRIRLTNIRCIDHLEISLGSDDPTGDSLLLLGNNAVGKSTILKSIAIGLCDSSSASGLVSDMYGNLIKDGHSTGIIEIDICSNSEEVKLRTTIKRSGESTGLERLEKKPKNFPWGEIFVCGYGPTRVMQGTNTYSEYAAVDAVYSLFSYSSLLQNPELVVRRMLADRPREEGRLLRRLSEVLMMEPNAVSLSRSGLSLSSTGGHNSTFGALADGHRSTLNWMLDLIGWSLLSGRSEPCGIVLIDEIENHLHPRWQRYVLSLLSKQFPRVQFIVTSHSALPAAGIYEDKSRSSRIGKAHVLRINETGEVINEEVPSVLGWTYDQILESAAFETPSRSVVLQRALDAVMDAYSGPDSAKSDRYRDAIKHLRHISPMNAASVQEEQIAADLDSELEALLKKRRKSNDSID